MTVIRFAYYFYINNTVLGENKMTNIYFLILNGKLISYASSFKEICLKKSGLLQNGFKPQIYDVFGNEILFVNI